MPAVGEFSSNLDHTSSQSGPKIFIIMTLTLLLLPAQAPIGNLSSTGSARFVAEAPSSSGFDNTWSLNNCPGGSETIAGGILQTRESSPGGDDDHYGFCSALRGSFPFGSHGDALPAGITTVSVSLNFLRRTLLSGSRYHIFVGLYFHLPNGPIQGCNMTLDNLGCRTYSWFEVQSRVENIHGVDSQAGTRDTYDPGDNFGYDAVVTQLSPGQSYNFTIGVEDQFARAAAAWSIDPTTSHLLSGIEIGTEGFRIQQVDVDWRSVTLVSGPPPPPPTLTASFTYSPSSPETGQQLTFTTTASGGTPPYSYAWDFGDGSSATGSSVTHAYSSAGNYTVTLYLADSSPVQQQASSQQTISVKNSASSSSQYSLSWEGYDWDGGREETVYLNGKFVASLPPTGVSSNGGAWASFSFNITSFVVDGTNILTFSHANWDCAVSDSVRNLQVNSGTAVVYSNATVLPLSCTKLLTYTFTVRTAPPLSANFSYSPTSPGQGQMVTFAASASGGISPYTFSWSFGDGTSDSGSSVSHSFSTQGTYTVTLIVKDSASPTSNTQTVNRSVIVSPPPTPPLTASFTYSPASPSVNGAVVFTAVASGGVSPYSFSWTFGDGTTGSGSSVTHSYASAATYTVVLTVRDSASPSPNSQTATQSVTLSAASSSGSYIVSWQGYDWDGGGEETITLNGQVVATLPAANSPQNGGVWASFALNITSFVVKGTNTLAFTHANWDCSTSDNVQNLQIVNGSTMVYANSIVLPLSCTQALTYTFTV